MAYIKDKLMIHSYVYYDADANEQMTTSILENPFDLINTTVKGLFGLQ
ncbi:MAG: hypothetical protein GY827_03445 [Cytophagales bacterium]|nr:hypothetical protein [Cytophagales bacterium]